MGKKVLVLFLSVWSCFILTNAGSECVEAWEIARNEKGVLLSGVSSLALYEGSCVAGTRGGVYLQTGDKFFSELSFGRLSRKIKEVFSFGDRLFALSSEGLYEWNGSEWKHFFRKRGLEGAKGGEMKGKFYMVAWDETDIFFFDRAQWRTLIPQVGITGVVDASFSQDKLYFLTSEGVVSFSKRGVWDRESVDIGGVLASDGQDESPAYNSLSSSAEKVIVTTGERVYVKQNKDWESLSALGTSGIIGSSFVAEDGSVLISTGSGIYLHRDEIRRWERIAPPSDGIEHLLLSGKGESGCLFVIASGRLYYKSLNGGSGISVKEKGFSFRPGHPGIADVHKMAIDFAKVSPEKIRSWRKRAAWQGILPELRFDYKRSMDDNIDIYTSVTTNYIVEGPREIDDEYSVRLTWDFSDLIWNRDQTAIDVRSRLMVQLRMQILEEVNRIYFEREYLLQDLKRKNGALDEISGVDKVKLRELEAHLDALTGGAFSRAANTPLRYR